MFITLFWQGSDIPIAPLMQRVIKEDGWLYILYRFLQNMVVGAFASFLVWSSSAGAAWGTEDIKPNAVAAAIAVGGAGAPIVNTFFQRAQDSETLRLLGDSIRDLISKQTGGSPGPTP